MQSLQWREYSAMANLDGLRACKAHLEDPAMTFLFNNCRNRDHSRYGEGAFFDLDLRGRQASLARDLRSGDSCVVASYGDAEVVFRWYSFGHEKRMLDEGGELVRVLFGRWTKTVSLAKGLAARTPPYAHLFEGRTR
jgi:hypothetical protein